MDMTGLKDGCVCGGGWGGVCGKEWGSGTRGASQRGVMQRFRREYVLCGVTVCS